MARKSIVVNVDGSGLTALTPPELNANGPKWSPDGSQFVFLRNYSRSTRWTPTARIWHSCLKTSVFLISSLVWSPDGERIAFHAYDNDRRIYVMNADGSDLKYVTEGPEDDVPAWSPDGTQIVFASVREDGNLRLYIMNDDGSDITPLTDDYGHHPNWAPAPQAAAPTASDCTATTSSAVNLRSGAGTDYPRTSTLAAGAHVAVDGQSTGTDGMRWWHLATGAWVRSDVVSVQGACDSLPEG